MRWLLHKLGAALLWLSAAVGVVFSSGWWDDGLHLLLKLLLDTEGGRRELALLLVSLQQSMQLYWAPLKWAAAATAGLALLAALPLLWRALTGWRPVVFISYQHAHEDEALAVAQALSQDGFRVRRVPFEPGADHQQVLNSMQQMQRGADAVVCLPGDAQSVVDAEVYAAAVAQQPVVFLVRPHDGSLPNAADKRYPVMKLPVARDFAWAPVAELLHHVTQDFRSTCAVYGRAMSHPGLGMATAPLLAALLLVLAVLLGIALLHGVSGTAGLASGDALMSGRVLAVKVGVLVLGALPLLAATVYLALVVVQVAVQLRAARRASLRAGVAAFRRDDWVGLIPGLEPGQPLYLSLMEQAPIAHHERRPKAARRARA